MRTLGMQATETSEGWEAMLLGLAALCEGLASEPSLAELGAAGQEQHLSGAQLQALLEGSASADARSAVLGIAAAQSGSQAAADIQSRHASCKTCAICAYETFHRARFRGGSTCMQCNAMRLQVYLA